MSNLTLSVSQPVSQSSRQLVSMSVCLCISFSTLGVRLLELSFSVFVALKDGGEEAWQYG